jgi:hypothetical protein
MTMIRQSSLYAGMGESHPTFQMSGWGQDI